MLDRGLLQARGQVSPNAFRSNGVEDVNEVLASLVVHPERIVVPLRTREQAVNDSLCFWNYVHHNSDAQMHRLWSPYQIRQIW